MANKKSKKEIVNDMAEQALSVYNALLDAIPGETYNASVAIACGSLFARYLAAGSTSQTAALANFADSIEIITREVRDFCEEFKKPIHTKIEDEES